MPRSPLRGRSFVSVADFTIDELKRCYPAPENEPESTVCTKATRPAVFSRIVVI